MPWGLHGLNHQEVAGSSPARRAPCGDSSVGRALTCLRTPRRCSCRVAHLGCGPVVSRVRRVRFPHVAFTRLSSRKAQDAGFSVRRPEFESPQTRSLTRPLAYARGARGCSPTARRWGPIPEVRVRFPSAASRDRRPAWQDTGAPRPRHRLTSRDQARARPSLRSRPAPWTFVHSARTTAARVESDRSLRHVPFLRGAHWGWSRALQARPDGFDSHALQVLSHPSARNPASRSSLARPHSLG